MKKFFAYIFKLFIVIYLTSFGIQFFINYGLVNKKDSVYSDWKNILDGNINADIIIMGSSRACVSYDPRIIENKLKLKTFNLGFNAGGYKLQEEKLKIYNQKNTVPKIIIQNIDLAHFGENKIIPDEIQFFPIIENSNVREFLKKYDSKYEYLHLIPLIRYNNYFSEITLGVNSIFGRKKTEKNITYKGFSPVNKKFKLDKHNIQKIDSLVIDNLILFKKIDEIIAFYKSNFDVNTKIVFVWAPEHKERLKKSYLLLKKPIIDRFDSVSLMNPNFYFINMMDNEISFNDNLYYDTFHLNYDGANKFTLKLLEELLNEKVINNAL